MNGTVEYLANVLWHLESNGLLWPVAVLFIMILVSIVLLVDVKKWHKKINIRLETLPSIEKELKELEFMVEGKQVFGKSVKQGGEEPKPANLPEATENFAPEAYESGDLKGLNAFFELVEVEKTDFRVGSGENEEDVESQHCKSLEEFYRFNEKNEEYQKLLDKEFEKLKNDEPLDKEPEKVFEKPDAADRLLEESEELIFDNETIFNRLIN